MYDVIIVGARCAGSPTAMLLARKGYKVLLVDRARFPSDTISTHIIWPHGAEILSRWGLLDRLAATGVPPVCRHMSFDVGPFVLRGTVPDANEGNGGFCPRRTVLDHLLVTAATEAGAEVREGVIVERLLFEGDTVVGVGGRIEGGGVFEVRARLVVGADGSHSVVARLAHAPEYDARPLAACAYYSYFSDVVQDDLELFVRDDTAFLGGPTNDGLHIVVVNWPTLTFPDVRADIEGHVSRALDLAPDFAARVRKGRRQEKWYGIAGVPNYFRKPYGAGCVGWRRQLLQGSDHGARHQRRVHRCGGDCGSRGRGLVGSSTSRRSARPARIRSQRACAADVRIHPATGGAQPPPPQMQQLFTALRDN